MKTLVQIAEFLGGTVLEGAPETAISDLAGVEDADQGDLTFFDSAKYRKAALASKATAMLVREKLAGWKGAQVQVAMPYLAFMQLVNDWYPAHRPAAGIHPSAVVDPSAKVDPTASVGPRATIDAGAVVGARSVIMAGAHLGRGVSVGEDCLVYPNAVIWERSRLGNRVFIHSGTVVGDDGFGYQRDADGHRKIPHVGYVEVQDDVEVGANATIDRGTFGRTVIGRGSKIDNLVQIAHNVRIGERTLVIAQAGIAGGSRIGNDVILAGQSGVADHAVIEDGVVAIPQTAIPKRAKSGTVLGGTPAMPYKDFLKASSAFRFLPDLLDRMRDVEKKLGITSVEKKQDEDGD